MDCTEVRDIIDAYALGVGAADEAAGIEAHVAECVRCWDELGKAQRTAALLALSSPMKDVPEGLEDRIMAIARQEAAAEERPARRQPLLQRLRLSWGSTAAGFGAASVAALAVAGVLQAQVNDLKTENNRIESQMRGTNQELAVQLRDANDTAENAEALLVSLVSASPQGVEMKMSGQPQPASVHYTWSADGETGWVICEHLAAAPAGMVYQVWFQHDTLNSRAATITPEDGDCLLTIDMSALPLTPTGVGISLEEAGVTSDSPDHWLAYAHFPAEN
ncbi:MAG TPA: anti-sigma factor [Dehalococcoidia bacterium]